MANIFTGILSKVARIAAARDKRIIVLDYPVNPTPRYGYGKPLHHRLYEIIERNRDKYEGHLKNILALKDFLLAIPAASAANFYEPCWINDYLPGLDSASIYYFLYRNKSPRYFEIGSGYSTMFARRAIRDHSLKTKITSIDPYPRKEIDSICDNIIRKPLEDVDPKVFNELESGDILFIDGTHRCFMNSDVTVAFLDILPRLKPGVLVEFHDILLPYDYPPGEEKKYYSEQYLLAAYILAEGNKFDIVLPNRYISEDPELKIILNPLWSNTRMKGVERHGGSFWIETR